MNHSLPNLPDRTTKPRETGVTMVMDKGLSLREAEDLVSVASEYIDYIKLGFGTSLITPDVTKKIKLFQKANIRVYAGGTLFEAFLIRNKYKEYQKYIDKMGFDAVEISDGSMIMDHKKKCEYIRELSKDRTVLSEVGSKEAGILIAPNRWIIMMQNELNSGSKFVIAEARESGNVGIYRPTGKAHITLINKILSKVPNDRIIWEAPLKSQQSWFIKHFGTNVNLGNISPSEIIPLETLRLGLRGDTFFDFLPAKCQKLKPA
ncbi:MAG: phosphosulfolactate synthase [Bacteroidota bacterium]|nr:phosphosulfolactate synthase [Bacteroidota bacterium]